MQQSHHTPGAAVELANVGEGDAYRFCISPHHAQQRRHPRQAAAAPSETDGLVLEGVLRTGQGKAAVIKGWDPLEGMEF